MALKKRSNSPDLLQESLEKHFKSLWALESRHRAKHARNLRKKEHWLGREASCEASGSL